MVRPLILLGKIIAWVSMCLNAGNGGTWPGEIAVKVNPDILSFFFKNTKKGIIIIAGTNGKTTTAKILKEVIQREYPKDKIVHNASGANLENGIVSACLKKGTVIGNNTIDWIVAEVDENTLPKVIKALQKTKTESICILTNLFRDQLDRYGEVDAIAAKWDKAIREYNGSMKIVANADDPGIAYIALKSNKQVTLYGADSEEKGRKGVEHATDSILCPKCGKKLEYKKVYYSHIGDWHCKNCGLERPKITPVKPVKSNFDGVYNTYNINAALLTLSLIGIKKEAALKGIETIAPAFGRQEIFNEEGRKIKIFLSKNPVGFNESIKTIKSLGGTNLLFVLNDRVPDGKDVSWIWDIDVEELENDTNITVSGDRCFDMALRLKYAEKKHNVKEALDEAIVDAIKKTKIGETIYILPTYSAMLEVRKILKGRKIL